jgi:MSHA biogenesis protein MshK
MKKHITATALFFSVLVPTGACAGNDYALPDPTKPAIVENKSGDGSMDSGQVSLTLQSVILRKGVKSSAVISGQRVELGQEIGGARLIRVTESEVTLANATGKEVLKMNPSVEKKLITEKIQVKSLAKKQKLATEKGLQ